MSISMFLDSMILIKSKCKTGNDDEGFYFQKYRTPPHYETKVWSLLNESFPGKWLNVKVQFTGLLSPLISHQLIFFQWVVVKDTVYARNQTTINKIVPKISLSLNWQWQITMQMGMHECIFMLTKMCLSFILYWFSKCVNTFMGTPNNQ